MALTDYKITNTQIAMKGVVSAPDRLTGTAAENKAIFDKLIREVVKDAVNGLIDELVAAGVGSEVLLPASNARMKYIRRNTSGVLETSTDGTSWVSTKVSVLNEVTETSLNGVLKGNGSVIGVKPVDSSPNAGNDENLISSAAVAKQILYINFGTLTGTGDTVTVTKEDAAITANHVPLFYELGNPAVQAGDITITTSPGAVQASGAINGSTTLKVVLGRYGKSIS